MESTATQETKSITINDLKYCLETQFNWNKIFGIIKDLYSDNGFQSNSDNMFRSKLFEWSIQLLSNCVYVDQDGVDFNMKLYDQIVNIEAKFCKNYFGKTKKCGNIKMKNYRGSTDMDTYERMRNENKFDYLMIIDTTQYRVGLADRDTAQRYYYPYGDGIWTKIPHSELTLMDIHPSTYTLPSSKVKLSTKIKPFCEEWMLDR
jgi:hypothetical protein